MLTRKHRAWRFSLNVTEVAVCDAIGGVAESTFQPAGQWCSTFSTACGVRVTMPGTPLAVTSGKTRLRSGFPKNSMRLVYACWPAIAKRSVASSVPWN
jgi:hypothetical protein